MRKLLVLGLVVGLLVAADFVARNVAESQLEERVSRSLEPSRDADVRVRSFPFLGRLLLSGDVTEVEAAIGNVVVQQLKFTEIAVELDDVRLNRQVLLSERRAELERVGRGFARADMSEAALSDLLGVPVDLEEGGVRLRGQAIAVEARVADNVLRLRVEGVTLPEVRIPKLPLMPCVAAVEAHEGFLRLTCTLAEVPAELLGRVNRVTA